MRWVVTLRNMNWWWLVVVKNERMNECERMCMGTWKSDELSMLLEVDMSISLRHKAKLNAVTVKAGALGVL